eukprot:gnl/MRDRNA2_/MRDRNA2_115991_c0_seq1.p1 gnl/MRDRNA2_/MRDRNA2_115991_c0~~gnl/MRDRNA2_/MRDRNA2_115991_c0_seq1.p1  ORF type:complete len:168 (-),score=44.24 gnl/MRDRNA2_/MRDRNA2_115991_c0_seq1:116-619(-)
MAGIEDFIKENESKLDEATIQALRESDEKIQEDVVARGSLETAKDPNAVVKDRIWKAKGKFNHYPGTEDFIKDNNLDEEASQALLNCNPTIQKEVIKSRKDGGVRNLDGVNNPSKAVIARIWKAKEWEYGGGMDAESMMAMFPYTSMLMQGMMGKGGKKGGKGFSPY